MNIDCCELYGRWNLESVGEGHKKGVWFSLDTGAGICLILREELTYGLENIFDRGATPPML